MKKHLYLLLITMLILGLSISLTSSANAQEPTDEPPTATTEPPTATTEPPTATTEPPTATTEPPTATTEPPTATTEPPTATTEPPTATTEPTEEVTATSTTQPPVPGVEPTEEVEPTAEITATATVAVTTEPLSAAVEAQAATSYNSGIQVQNLESTLANIVLVAYKKDGTTAANVTGQTVPANGSKTYFPLGNLPTASTPGLGLTGSFDGSVVVNSDRSVVAIANVFATGSSGKAIFASYGSSSTGAPTVNLPLLMKNNGGFATKFNVQSTNTSGDVNVTVTYTPGSAGNAGCTQSATIKPGAAATFDQEADTTFGGCAGGLGTTFVGSAQVVATGGNIVASVLEVSSNTLFAYSGFTGGSTNVALPLINANNGGFVTGIQIQNLGGSNTDVTLAYKPSVAGTACSETKTVLAGKSATFALGAFASTQAGEDCANGVKFVGSATVSSNTGGQNLVAIVNQLNSAAGKGGAYNGFNPANATSKVSLPLMMDNNGGFFTGYSILNVGSATTLSCTYSTSGGHTPTSVGGALAANTPFTQNDGGRLRPNASTAYVGSALCSAPGGSIVGIANELGGTGDTLLVYEGFNTN